MATKQRPNAAPDYVAGCWHQIVFTSDVADVEVTHFAAAMKRAYESSGRPKNCEAYRHEGPNGVQSIFISPGASALAYGIPTYRPLLESIGMIKPIEKNYPALNPMGIFD